MDCTLAAWVGPTASESELLLRRNQAEIHSRRVIPVRRCWRTRSPQRRVLTSVSARGAQQGGSGGLVEDVDRVGPSRHARVAASTLRNPKRRPAPVTAWTKPAHLNDNFPIESGTRTEVTSSSASGTASAVVPPMRTSARHPQRRSRPVPRASPRSASGPAGEFDEDPHCERSPRSVQRGEQAVARCGPGPLVAQARNIGSRGGRASVRGSPNGQQVQARRHRRSPEADREPGPYASAGQTSDSRLPEITL